jgi:hypothetical protein
MRDGAEAGEVMRDWAEARGAMRREERKREREKREDENAMPAFPGVFLGAEANGFAEVTTADPLGARRDRCGAERCMRCVKSLSLLPGARGAATRGSP